MLKDKVIKVPESVDLFGEKLVSFLKILDKCIEDGWQTGQDLPLIATAALTELVPAVGQIKAASEDFKAYPYESGKALAVHLADVIQAFATKPAAPQA